LFESLVWPTNGKIVLQRQTADAGLCRTAEPVRSTQLQTFLLRVFNFHPLANLAWHNASIVNHFSRKETIIYPKLLIYYAYVVM